MQMLIKGGRVLDPGVYDGSADILIDDGRIVQIRPQTDRNAPDVSEPGTDSRIIDAKGLVVIPGLIDMHVHLRDPGQEYKETIETGTKAAAAGGFTAVCCMPNTDPVNDTSQVTRYIVDRAQACRSARVYPVGAISRGLKGDSLSEYGELKRAGAVAVSDDGRPVTDSQLMRRAMEYARGIGLLVIAHCEDLYLAGGAMNEGAVSTRLGLKGIPNAVESIMVMRDIALCKLTGTPLHIAHVSTRESVAAIRAAKKEGLSVTAETAPHYFTLTDAAVEAYNTHAKMNPPLRTETDRIAVIEGLADGTLDAIATDHAPHAEIEKALEFDKAANGIIGLETAFGLGMQLVENGDLTLEAYIEKMTRKPARILGLPCGLEPGMAADITIFDPADNYTYSAAKGFSKSRNTPFDGWQMKGRVHYTIVGGQVVFAASEHKT